jgi:hypothetical protein
MQDLEAYGSLKEVKFLIGNKSDIATERTITHAKAKDYAT